MSDGRRIIKLEEFDDEDFVDESESHTDMVRSKRKKRGLFSFRNLMVSLVLLVAIGIFLPQILAYTPLGDVALGYLVPADKGTLRIHGRDLAWWKPVSVSDIQLDGPSGQPLVKVKQLKTTRTLWEIASKMGVQSLSIDGLVVHLKVRPDGSNIEDFAAKFLAPQEPSPKQTSLEPIDIKIQNSEVHVSNDLEKRSWVLTNLNANLSVGKNAEAVLVDLNNEFADSLGTVSGGKVHAKIAFAQPSAVSSAFTKIHNGQGYLSWSSSKAGVAFSVQTEKMPMGLVQTLATRVDPKLKVGGLAYGNLHGTTDLLGQEADVKLEQLSIANLNFSHHAWIGADVVRQQRVDVTGGAAIAGDQLQLDDTRLQADVGNVSVNGKVSFSDIWKLIQHQRLPGADIASSANLNLAGLAKQLPSTLSLKQDIALNSGSLKWDLFNQRQNDGSVRLYADVSASGIQGRSGASNFRWANPVRLSGALRDYGRPLEFEFVKAESDFLNANLNPTADGGVDGKVAVDFNRMRTALKQVFQLPPMRMAGTGSGTLKLLSARANGGNAKDILARLNLSLNNVDISFPGVFELQDPAVKVALNADFQPKQLTAGDQGKHLWRFFQDPENLILKSGKVSLVTDRGGLARGHGFQNLATNTAIDPATLGLSADLIQPVDLQHLVGTSAGNAEGTGHADRLNARFQVHGAVDRWLQIVRPLLTGVDLAATGFAQGKGEIVLSPRIVQVSKLDLQGTNIGFRGFGLLLNEPKVIANGAFSYDLLKGTINVPDATAACSTIALRAVKFDAAVGSKLDMKGDIYFRSDVARLWDTLQKFNQTGTAQQNGGLLGKWLPRIQNQLVAGLVPSTLATSYVSTGFQDQATDRIASRPPIASQASDSNLLMGGGWIGHLQVTPQVSGERVFKLESTIGNFWVGGYQPGGQKVAYFKEPKVHVKSQATTAEDFDRVDIKSFDIQADRGTLRAAGSIQKLLSSPLIDVQGGLNADVIGLVKPLGGVVTSDLAVNGLRSHNFRLQGPVDVKKLTGSWTTSWDRIHWMGLDGGPANVQINLKNGLIETVPVQMAIGSGSVRLAPVVDMTGESMWIRHPQGVICKDVKLTPEICRHWLKYAAPLLAQVTSVQGHFSLDSDGVEVPLADWTRMVAKARVTINGARVGPGPLGIKISQLVRSVKTLSKLKNLDVSSLSQLGIGLPGGQGGGTDLISGLLGGNQAAVNTNGLATTNPQNQSVSLSQGGDIWMSLPVQTIPLEYNKGEFKHQNVKMSIDGFSLVSQGVVRIDQSIAATADLKVPDDVLKKNPQVAAAIGNSLKLPISGTLTKPRVDTNGVRTALLNAAQKGVQDAAVGRLQKELQNRIGDKNKKLFDIGKGLLGNPNQGNQKGTSLKEEADRLLKKNLNKGLNKLFGNR